MLISHINLVYLYHIPLTSVLLPPTITPLVQILLPLIPTTPFTVTLVPLMTMNMDHQDQSLHHHQFAHPGNQSHQESILTPSAADSPGFLTQSANEDHPHFIQADKETDQHHNETDKDQSYAIC